MKVRAYFRSFKTLVQICAAVTTNNDPHRKSTPGHFSTQKSDRGFIFYDQRGHFSSAENVSLPLNQAEKSDPL